MKTVFAQANGYQYGDVYSTSTYRQSTVPAKTDFQILFKKVSVISGTVSAFFIALILYCIIRMFMIQKHEIEHRDHLIHEYKEKMIEAAKNPRWELIENLMLSPAEADWRVAIIEADVLLEETLRDAGFTGDGIGEMLTNSGPNSFSTYQFAWDAHKVRNEIAHQGFLYKVTKEDTIRNIAMYRAVLEEFGVV